MLLFLELVGDAVGLLERRTPFRFPLTLRQWGDTMLLTGDTVFYVVHVHATFSFPV